MNKFEYLKALHGVDITPAQFRVLVTILDYSDQNGNRAFPGVENLVSDCCLSTATVKRCLAALEGAGWLTKVSRGGRSGDGRKRASEYALSAPDSTAHKRSVDIDGQQIKSTISTDQIDDLNSSSDACQQLTGDTPSNPLTTDPLTTNHVHQGEDGCFEHFNSSSVTRAREQEKLFLERLDNLKRPSHRDDPCPF
ncbi:helix-turn-helix domain-containing protein [Mycobacteroides chelonae]|uniref:helix-turn-helix domain-containing protein n=1 Tax=Mycobacteroides chelonae TaxID=1774 RepID=UPI003AAD979D